jgi:Circularly permutated YpsA SLOG family
MGVTKIVSGGQTGVDRGALDAALAVGFACGGWCPGDRMAEDGPIPEKYPLMPLPNGGYRERTLVMLCLFVGGREGSDCRSGKAPC